MSGPNLESDASAYLAFLHQPHTPPFYGSAPAPVGNPRAGSDGGPVSRRWDCYRWLGPDPHPGLDRGLIGDPDAEALLGLVWSRIGTDAAETVTCHDRRDVMSWVGGVIESLTGTRVTDPMRVLGPVWVALGEDRIVVAEHGHLDGTVTAVIVIPDRAPVLTPRFLMLPVEPV